MKGFFTVLTIVLVSFTGHSWSNAHADEFEPAVETLILYDEQAAPVGQVQWADVKPGMPDEIVMNDYGLFEVTLADQSSGWLDASMFSKVLGKECTQQEIASAEIAGKSAVTAGGMGAGGDC